MPPRKAEGWRIDRMISPALVLVLISNILGLGYVGLQVKWKGEQTADQLALLKIDRDGDRQEITAMKIQLARLDERFGAQDNILKRIDANTSKSKPGSEGGG